MNQLEAKIKPGEYMAIAKGTIFHTIERKYSSPKPITDVSSVTIRDQILRVSDIVPVYSDTEWIDVDYTVLCYDHNNSPIDRIIPRKERKIINHKAFWAGTKYVDVSLVTSATAPIRKEIDPDTVSIPKEPTLRMRMVSGTKWKLTVPANVMKNVRTMQPPGAPTRWIDSLEIDYVIPIDSEIEIIKFQKFGPAYSEGMWVQVLLNGNDILVEYNQLNQKPEQVGEVEVIPVFYIWDKATKQYYSGYEYGDYVDRDPDGYLLSCDRSPTVINYSTKLTKAKSFKQLHLVRTHVLIQSGYYANLPDTWGEIPDWMCGDKSFDIPNTWEIVKFDKLTKQELCRFELMDTFDRSWKLRALTIKYGSAVRSVYSVIEKKGKLSEFTAMLMFNAPRDSNGKLQQSELSETEKDAITFLLKQFNKKEVTICKSTSGFAVGAKDVDTAMMVRLAYAGDLECGVIDFTEMSDVFYSGTT